MSELSWGATTDIGSVRELNEDAVLAATPVFAVADGMGGHAAGEVAAAVALERLAELVGRTDVSREDVLAVVASANAAILSRANANRDTLGMGTTLSGVCLGSVGGVPHWLVFNVGDSRVYRLAGGVMCQVTVDHSEVEELVSAGEISRNEARQHPSRNIVTRSLGTDPPPRPDVWVVPAEPGDLFLVCSDGLTNEVTDEVIAEVLRRAGSPQRAADELIALALAAGAHDNVSAVVVGLPSGPAGMTVDITAPRGKLRGAENG